MLEHATPVIADFLTGFQRDPFGTAEETELHKSLFSALYRQFDQLDLRFEMEKAGLDISYYPERSGIKLNPVRTAYPSSEKFDIAILGGQARSGDDSERFSTYWQQPVAVAINLYLCADADLAVKYLRKLDKDRKRMTGFQAGQAKDTAFAGLSLLLVAGDAPDGLSDSIFPDLNPGFQAWVAAEDGLYAYNGTA